MSKIEVRRSDKRLVATVDTAKLAANVRDAILEAGIKVILLNTYNGKGKDATDDDRQAALDKKLAAWYRGEFNVVERGDSFKSLMREAFYAAEAERLGKSLSSVEKLYNKLIDDTLPKDGDKLPAKSVDNLFRAVAMQVAKSRNEVNKAAAEKAGQEFVPVNPDDIQRALEDKYSKAAESLAAERAEAKAGIDVTGIDI